MSVSISALKANDIVLQTNVLRPICKSDMHLIKRQVSTLDDDTIYLFEWRKAFL